jgi:hypothetical protein
MISIESSVWCDLVSLWIAGEGIDALDAIVRSRLSSHAQRCQDCPALLHQLVDDSVHASGSPQWPHLSDETLRLVTTGSLSETEEQLFTTSIEPHLQVCDYCADRLAAIQELPNAPEQHQVVVGRGVTTPIRWNENYAELGWVMDQPGTGLSVWRMSLTMSLNELKAMLSIEGTGVPTVWRFSVPLATDEQFLPTLVFTPDVTSIRFPCDAESGSSWQATPILTMTPPAWTQLIAIGEDPATMVSLDDAKRKEMSLRMAYDGPLDLQAVERLSGLLADLRGERLNLTPASSVATDALTGSVVNRSAQNIGTWSLRLQDRSLHLVISSVDGEVIRLMSPPSDDSDFIQLRSDISSESARVLAFPERRPLATTRIEEVVELGLAADGSSRRPMEQGRKLLVRGRHEFKLRTGDYVAKIEVEEREYRLCVRFIDGTPLHMVGSAEPLTGSMECIDVGDALSVKTVLQRSLEWCE